MWCREWTLEGEMERSGAAAYQVESASVHCTTTVACYQVMWSEKMIRELMCSERLREVRTAH